MTTPSITDPLDWLAATDPDAPFIVGVMTYGDLARAIPAMAGGLVSRGVVAGDRVAAQIEKSPEALVLYLACMWIGAIYMPLNTGYTQTEIDYFITDAEPALFVTDEVLAGLEGEPAPRVWPDPEAQAAMLYTSGTTGKPKGTMIPRRALASNGAALAKLWRFAPTDVLLHALPVYHVHGLFVATNTVLAAGASMVFLDKFDADIVLRTLPECTVMMGVPTFYTRLLQKREQLAEAARDIRLFVSGSAPLLAETHAAFEAVTGHAILERYGMTETQINSSHPYEGPRLPGTVGLPVPGVEVRITDTEDGIGQDGIGMIEVRGQNLFTGYWRQPEKTAEDMRGGGWFATGDLGRIDERGHIQIIGRGKDLIISGGLNIYPGEIESAINDLPGVDESAVIGVPHPDFGEAVVAVVVGSHPDILAALRGQMARFKLPKTIVVLPELPRNAMGKVQKNLLRDQFVGLFTG
jgi:malonyl-CoA/methylmalonyl-CoA synthetase